MFPFNASVFSPPNSSSLCHSPMFLYDTWQLSASLFLSYCLLFIVYNIISLFSQNPKPGQSLPFIVMVYMHFCEFLERRILMSRGRWDREEDLSVFIFYWIIPLDGRVIYSGHKSPESSLLEVFFRMLLGRNLNKQQQQQKTRRVICSVTLFLVRIRSHSKLLIFSFQWKTSWY